MFRCASAAFFIAIYFLARSALAGPPSEFSLDENRKVVPYTLESVELEGTTRLTAEQVTRELGLKIGAPMYEELVMTARTRLLSLGLFKNVILLMKKGTTKGHARLVIQVEDDDLVLTDWALGGSLSIIQPERQAVSDPNGAPVFYELELVGRNFFNALHRASLLVDIDSKGILQKGNIAYGLPRFAAEETQFDAQVSVVNPYTRYLDTLGFGSKAQGLWSQLVQDYGSFRYGPALYSNQQKNFQMPGFPRLVLGPYFGFERETRLRAFLPGEGHAVGAAFLLSLNRAADSVVEFNFAHTLSVFHWPPLFTLSADVMSVGLQGYGFRAKGRVDFPLYLGWDLAKAEQAELFLQVRGGIDVIGDKNYIGSDTIVGFRFHSSGFIAELGLMMTRSPSEFIRNPIRGAMEGVLGRDGAKGAPHG